MFCKDREVDFRKFISCNLYLCSGGSVSSASDVPSPESVVNWLIEHVETLPHEDSDSESVSSVDYDSDTDSTSDVFEDLDSSGEVGFLLLW